ncbi:sensor domain-containing diguanylate cyclase [Anaerolentibacter hominis]|uniref:sensor domain-containing diguanylate cyclase n=1 Tax=Anaerolentibacter hominis TaxID=3079009 RepID=UPI0031B8A1A6
MAQRIKKKKFQRVDFQVSIFVSLLCIATILVIYLFNYNLTYHDMLDSLKKQVNSIYQYVESSVTEETFTSIANEKDMETASYSQLKTLLEQVRDITGVKYLYTATRTGDNQLIYVVDGLDEAADDFRKPGDPIEEEIRDDLNQAMNGHTVLPNDILHTSWGDIFIVYYPIHGNSGNVIGALGIEVDASHQYKTYRTLRAGTLCSSILVVFVAVVISVLMFRRISNPFYKDIANTDYLTRCKNRNAFEIDINNSIRSGRQTKNTMILSVDLNGLKQVNDTFGHDNGDQYIKAAASVLEEAAGKRFIVYRMGGDEFLLLGEADGEREVNALARQITESIQHMNDRNIYPFSLSVSYGFAFFDPDTDQTLHDTYQRSDRSMYQMKREYYAKDSYGYRK